MSDFASLPMHTVGPILINGPVISQEEFMVPLATFEIPLWSSTNRGAKATRLAGGISAAILKDNMTRSIVLEAKNMLLALEALQNLNKCYSDIEAVVRSSSRYATLLDWHAEQVGNLIFVRFAFTTGNASGHNMATKAADEIILWILTKFPVLQYVSVSGNYCTDKKVSAVNGILGRGKHCIAEAVISEELCSKVLKSTPTKIHELNIKKNLIGSILAGSLRSANAHYANALLGFYLATGQDAANIVEGSQGVTYTALEGKNLYFSVSIPNIIIGTVGNGKTHPFVLENLRSLNCFDSEDSSRRLAVVCAATVLCAELSLLAAQTNPGELMCSHLGMEREAV